MQLYIVEYPISNQYAEASPIPVEYDYDKNGFIRYHIITSTILLFKQIEKIYNDTDILGMEYSKQFHRCYTGSAVHDSGAFLL